MRRLEKSKRVKELNARWGVDCSDIYNYYGKINNRKELDIILRAGKLRNRVMCELYWSDAIRLAENFNDEGLDRIVVFKDVKSALEHVKWKTYAM